MGLLEGAVATVPGSPWQPWYDILRVAGFAKGGIWSVHKTSETQGSEYLLFAFK